MSIIELLPRKESANLPGELVFQHTYGIVAPQKDANQVARLLMPGMLTCFGLSIHDPQRQVGMATHIDMLHRFFPMIEEVIPLLESLGGRAFQVRTVNMLGPTAKTIREVKQKGMVMGGSGIEESDIAKRREAVELLMGILKDRSLFDWKDKRNQGNDLGSSGDAYFDARTGLRIVPERLQLSRQQEDTVINVNREAIAQSLFVTPWLLPFEPAYLPSPLRERSLTSDTLSVE